MNPITGVAIYFVVWWLALFAVLPWGTRPVAEPDAQTGWRGAPAQPRLRMKIVATTIVAAVIWLLIFVAMTSNLFSIDGSWLGMPTY